MVAWGDNSYGQTNVTRGLSSVVAVAAGKYHSLALNSNGTVAAWGVSTYVNVSSNMVAVGAGGDNSLALKSDWTVASWVESGFDDTKAPVGLSNVVAVAAGGYHSLALVGNSTPVAISQTNFGFPNNDLTIHLSGTDADGDSLSFKICDIPSTNVGFLYQFSSDGSRGGIISTNNSWVTDASGRVIFRPALNAHDTNGAPYAALKFVANDGLIDSAPGTVTIHVIYTLPNVMSQPAALVTGASAMLLGMVNPNRLPTTAWFEWGTSSAYGKSNAPVSVGNGATVVWVTNSITGLTNYQVYHFRLAVSDSVGGGDVRSGPDICCWQEGFGLGIQLVRPDQCACWLEQCGGGGGGLLSQFGAQK